MYVLVSGDNVPATCDGSSSCYREVSFGHLTTALRFIPNTNETVLTYINAEVRDECNGHRPSTNITLSCPRFAKVKKYYFCILDLITICFVIQ